MKAGMKVCVPSAVTVLGLNYQLALLFRRGSCLGLTRMETKTVQTQGLTHPVSTQGRAGSQGEKQEELKVMV